MSAILYKKNAEGVIVSEKVKPQRVASLLLGGSFKADPKDFEVVKEKKTKAKKEG